MIITVGGLATVRSKNLVSHLFGWFVGFAKCCRAIAYIARIFGVHKICQCLPVFAELATNGDLDELKDTVIGEDADDSEIEIEPTRVYRVEDARQFLTAKGVDVDGIAPQVDGKFASAFIRAKKPSGQSTR